MNGIRRLSQKHLLFGAHAVCLVNGERTNCGRGCSFSVFCCQQTNIGCIKKRVKGNTGRESSCRLMLCRISPVADKVHYGPALRAPPSPTLIQPIWLIKKKRACRGKQHTLIGIISKIEKIICSYFTVGGNFKMPRDNDDSNNGWYENRGWLEKII